MFKKPILAIAFVALAAMKAQAQDATTFRYSHLFAASHTHYAEGFKFFADLVAERTQGKIKFAPFHSGQLGKEGATLLTSGLADAAHVIPSYEAQKFPLSSVSELPGLNSSACEGTRRFWNIVKTGAPLNLAEYKPRGLHVLFVLANPQFQILTSSKKVSSLDDVGKMKLRAVGSAMDKMTRLLGAIPISVTAPELYDAISRGTVDGAFFPAWSMRTNGLEKQVHYALRGPKFGSVNGIFAMSDKAWATLSPENQELMTKAAAEAQEHHCKYLESMDVEVTDWLVKDYGLQVTTVTGAEADLWEKRIAPVAKEWAKEMDRSGRDGSGILRAYEEAPTTN